MCIRDRFRTIPSEVLTLEDLGCPPLFKQLIEQPQGLILSLIHI